MHRKQISITKLEGEELRRKGGGGVWTGLGEGQPVNSFLIEFQSCYQEMDHTAYRIIATKKQKWML
jgi:hypothetical protein